MADLIGGVPAAGFNVALACPEGGDLGDLAQGVGCRVFEIPLDAGLSSAALRQLRATVAAFDPTIVHAHGSRAAALARLADPVASRRLIYTVHGIHVDRAGSPARRAALTTVERLLARRTARFITVCRSDAARGAKLRVLTLNRTTTIYNGVPYPPPSVQRGRFRAQLGLEASTRLVLSVGRFHEQKDQLTLLRAWGKTTQTLPNATLAIVGSGELEGVLRAEVAAQGVSDRVRFVAPRPDLSEAYADADCFALSSRWEGFPYVVLEAMAHGLPVVSTAVDGIPEAVVHGVTGLLVPARDSSALAAALSNVLSNPDYRRDLGAAGQKRVSTDFSLTGMLDRIVALYVDVLESSASGRVTPGPEQT